MFSTKANNCQQPSTYNLPLSYAVRRKWFMRFTSWLFGKLLEKIVSTRLNFRNFNLTQLFRYADIVETHYSRISGTYCILNETYVNVTLSNEIRRTVNDSRPNSAVKTILSTAHGVRVLILQATKVQTTETFCFYFKQFHLRISTIRHYSLVSGAFHKTVHPVGIEWSCSAVQSLNKRVPS